MIKGKVQLSKMELKRFYLPGLKLSHTCEKCNQESIIELSHHYPYSFKDSGECQLSFLCTHCEEAVDLTLKLEINLKVI